jgi:hypothetical protein
VRAAPTLLRGELVPLFLRSLVEDRGTEQDHAGDGFFATFDGPGRAVRCA